MSLLDPPDAPLPELEPHAATSATNGSVKSAFLIIGPRRIKLHAP
jgi:hypothetical protein